MAVATRVQGVVFTDPSGMRTSRPPITRGTHPPIDLSVDSEGRRIAVAWADQAGITVHDLASGAILGEFSFSPSPSAPTPSGSPTRGSKARSFWTGSAPRSLRGHWVVTIARSVLPSAPTALPSQAHPGTGLPFSGMSPGRGSPSSFGVTARPSTTRPSARMVAGLPLRATTTPPASGTCSPVSPWPRFPVPGS